MSNYSKAIGAAIGGGLAGTIGLPAMPDDTPWWGYLLLYVVSVGLPAVITYIAPKNSNT